MRIIKILDALSQLANVAFLPRHKETNANESVSGRAHRQGWKKTERILDGLFFWEKNHCMDSHQLDLIRARKFLEGE